MCCLIPRVEIERRIFAREFSYESDKDCFNDKDLHPEVRAVRRAAVLQTALLAGAGDGHQGGRHLSLRGRLHNHWHAEERQLEVRLLHGTKDHRDTDEHSSGGVVLAGYS